MREIHLYGHLGKKFGSHFRLNVSSPAEALRALRANFPDFEVYMQKFAKQGFRVRVGRDAVDHVGLVTESKGRSISFTPVVSGAGRGVGQIILGAVIIAAAMSGAGAFAIAAMTSTAAAATAVTSAIVSFGASMVLGGVVQMLTKPPAATSKESADNKPSYAFNGPVQTTGQGNCVPICYGEMIVGSQVGSAGLNIENTFSAPGGTPGNNGGSAGASRPYIKAAWDDQNDY